MKIGIFGVGVIGQAHADAFRDFGHEVYLHDLKLETKIEDLLKTDAIYVCLPTPASKTGECNVEIISSELSRLKKIGYAGCVVLKSTVPPTFFSLFKDLNEDLDLVYSPEFLRERRAYDDLLEEKLLIVGGGSEVSQASVRNVYASCEKKLFYCTYEEASLIKYFHNTFNAMRVVFANQFSDVCDTFDTVDYENVLAAFCEKNGLKDEYLRVSPDLRGYSGPCLPKDTKAMGFLASKLMGRNIWSLIDEINSKYKPTVPKGMRFE